MSGHRIADRRQVRSAAIVWKALPLILLLLALLALAGCGGTGAPAAGPSVAPSTSTMAAAPAPATETVPATRKPTATFVPLITPSATIEGGALTSSAVPRIEIGVARQMADAGEAVLVDVRTQGTYEQAHIAGAISMPSGEVAVRYQELPTNKLVIFY